MEGNPNDERVILQMIQLVSDWNISKANRARISMEENPIEWKNKAGLFGVLFKY